MISPCVNCVRKGCGRYHDVCPKYLVFREKCDTAAALRNAEAEIVDCKVKSRLRVRGKRHDKP